MRRRLALLALAIGASACAPLPTEDDEGGAAAPPATTEPAAGEAGVPAVTGAVAALLAESRGYQASSDYAQAAASLERAVRIEPANPWLWIELAEVHRAAGNGSQAEAHARKALALAGDDDAAREAAEGLLARIAAG